MSLDNSNSTLCASPFSLISNETLDSEDENSGFCEDIKGSNDSNQSILSTSTPLISPIKKCDAEFKTPLPSPIKPKNPLSHLSTPMHGKKTSQQSKTVPLYYSPKNQGNIGYDLTLKDPEGDHTTFIKRKTRIPIAVMKKLPRPKFDDDDDDNPEHTETKRKSPPPTARKNNTKSATEKISRFRKVTFDAPGK